MLWRKIKQENEAESATSQQKDSTFQETGQGSLIKMKTFELRSKGAEGGGYADNLGEITWGEVTEESL